MELNVPSTELRDFPYLIHTNRELGLMLSGRKPMASFADVKGRFPECVIRYLRLFDRHVAVGRLARLDRYSSRNDSRGTYTLHRIMFALPGEEWRMHALIDLWENNGPWTVQSERREGELLGYEDWMNDYWISHLSK
ncbi:MAG: hypothetical protein ACRCSO_00725 [Sphingomonas sp.]